jgi:activating signal cointegrator 1
MQAISVNQPWASLIIAGAKRIETRSWSTNHRGPLAIHASKKFTPAAKLLCATEPFQSCLASAGFEGWEQRKKGVGRVGSLF